MLVTDSDSSETDTEELIRQEMIKRKEERRAKLEARKKAEGEATVTNEAHVNGSTGEGERAMEMEDRAADKTVTLLSHDNHTAVSEAGCSQHVSREELYSPQKSVLAVSPHEQQMKVMPSRSVLSPLSRPSLQFVQCTVGCQYMKPEGIWITDYLSAQSVFFPSNTQQTFYEYHYWGVG